MSTNLRLTEEEDNNIYNAKKILQLIAALSSAETRKQECVYIDKETLSVLALVLGNLLPDRI